MSSNNNNESSAAMMVVAFIGAAIMMVALFVMALLAFAAFALTILSIFAWNKPLCLGRLVIMPDEARGFVWRGIIGAFMVPAFLVFTSLFFDLNIAWEYLLHFMLAGYVGGSIGMEILFAQDDRMSARPIFDHPAQPTLPAPAQKALPPADPAGFRYASWDDEEARGS